MKIFEIRDHMTHVEWLCIKSGTLSKEQRDKIIYAVGANDRLQTLAAPAIRESQMWGRNGYGAGWEGIIVMPLHHLSETKYDPYSWDNDRYRVLHAYIIDHWADLAHTALIDIQHIIGETDQPVASDFWKSL